MTESAQSPNPPSVAGDTPSSGGVGGEEESLASSPIPGEDEDSPILVDDRVGKVLAGQLDNLPPLQSKIVRIFTSSTFTDTTLERNALMENIYPQLKEYCREKHGLEFQVVDMRWGVRDEATDDHMTTELCMNEIETCQRLSVGPNFIVFLGQKYGYRPIPTIIPSSEFQMLLEVIKDVPDDAKLLTQWYKPDMNVVPPVHILQPISTILVNFNNKRHQRLMEQDQNTWWDIMGQLQRMLRKGAQVLMMARKMDRDQMHNYFMSVTEREVRKGIINASGTKEHCLAYVRHIDNMNLALMRFARNFIDMASRDVDHEAQKLLSILRDEKLPAKLVPENLFRFKIEWTGKEGIDRDCHADYLKSFCDSFYTNCVRLIDNDVRANEKLSDEPVYAEVLQHAHHCAKITRLFLGRDQAMEKIRRYMTDTEVHSPLVLYGHSGSGKTALLSKAYSNTFNWFSESVPVMVLRFLGTSPDSSSVIPLLRSICTQVAIQYGQPTEEIPEELSRLTQHMKKLIECAEEERPLCIFLDSLDQISAADGGHQLSWLPINLPPYVKIVLSTLPKFSGILDTFKRMVKNEQLYVEVEPLGENLGQDILKLWLKNANKTVQEPQWKIVNSALAKCNLPLFVELVFDEVCRWKSYSPPRMTTLAYTIHDSIMKLLDRVENQHGKILVQHALGYLTAAKSGLSEAELEDLLSLDEKVLNDVYQYHLPPTRRIPPLLWTRIRNDLPAYFSEREADGVNVINWYHRQFIDASRERYFRNINFLREVHSNIADYFLGIWGGVAKPFEYSELQRQRFFLSDTKGESDRKVPEQPLAFTDVMGRITRYNLRKLSELPFHLIRSQRFEDLYKEVLFNFRWLHAKLSCMPLTAVLADFEDALDHQFDKNVKIVADTLRLSASMLSRNPDMAAPQIVGRLLPYYQANDMIRFLIDQCDTDGLHVNALVPSYHCMHTPGGPLQNSLEGHPFAPFGCAITSNSKYLVSVSNIFILWDLSTGDVFRSVNPGIQGIMQDLRVSPDDKTAGGYTNNNIMVICFLMTGEFNLVPIKTAGGDNLVGLDVTDSHVLTWTHHEWFIYSFDGTLEAHDTVDKDHGMLIYMDITDLASERFLVTKTEGGIPGVESDEDMSLHAQNGKTENFDFHSAIAISLDRETLYACIAISDDCVACYKRIDDQWKYDRTLGDNKDHVFSLTFSQDEAFLVGTVAFGYKLWDLRTDKVVDCKLPVGVRNIPTKNQLTGLVTFTKGMQFVVAAVRKNIYAWDTKVGNLVKTLDAHFGRIINIVAVPSLNKLISSSMDKTIKVWNFDNILEDVHSIHRHDKPIEAVSLAANAYVGATTTRNCVGIWNLENGKLLKTLANSAHSSIVTHAEISGDARWVASAESGHVLIWDVEASKVLHSDEQKDVKQLILAEADTRVITLSKLTATKGRCMCRSVPQGEVIYQFDYNMRKFMKAVLTCDGASLVVPALDKNTEVLSLYNARDGTKSYDMVPKYTDYKEYESLIAMPHDPNQVALIDPDKGNVWDIKKKHIVRSVKRWNGVCSKSGKFGLYAPNRGGLELLELKTGKTKFVMLPRVAEGVFGVSTLFTKTDQHVVYYHHRRRSIRVFRVSDGKQIADYTAHAELTAIEGTEGGAAIVLGAVDGSVVVLAVADPKNESSHEFLSSLPSRQESGELEQGFIDESKETSTSVAGLVQIARAIGKAKNAQRSRACVIS